MKKETKETILIIDDEDKIRTLLAKILTLEGYEIITSHDLKSAWKIIEKESQHIGLILCDVKLPDGSGVDFTQKINAQFKNIPIILLTAYGSITDGVQAMKNGAVDYLVKGDDNEKIIPLVAKVFENTQKNTNKKHHLFSFEEIIGVSESIENAKKKAQKVAKTDTNVLLLGETGTGKELFAQAIHQESNRSEHTFLAINCGAFSHHILESELFGHKAGSFTGAVKDKKGLLEEANEGTIFLDEIGEMNIELQAKLLRFLETRTFIKVGDTKNTQVNIRIIAATHRNLLEEIEKNNFRQDLYYRLSVFTISLPNLSQRKEDVSLLVEHFRTYFLKQMQHLEPVFFTQKALDVLENYHWKGNIRELKNVVERCLILAEKEITENDLWFDKPIQKNNDNEKEIFELKEIEKRHIKKIMDYTDQNKTETARLLGIGLTTLYRKIEEFKL
ncbi:MAG: sigma-54-dependent Fis family transcriptional regulator [Bacteroidetes bacterium]|nr:MAG: sigma-54-dependent Fis family transcriptional regulator [Bacteroidota bacterium]TAG89629.1 MAG: sigma-54-dependent Fis family transcriptional regulator [Bacteroidota bacterium]